MPVYCVAVMVEGQPDVLRKLGSAPTGHPAFQLALVQLRSKGGDVVRGPPPVCAPGISPELGKPPAGQPDAAPRRLKVYSSDFGVLAFKVSPGQGMAHLKQLCEQGSSVSCQICITGLANTLLCPPTHHAAAQGEGCAIIGAWPVPLGPHG